MGENAKVVRRPEDLTRNELEGFAHAVIRYAFLTRVDGGFAFDPTLEVEGADFVEDILSVIDSYGMTPAAGPVEAAPRRLIYPWEVRDRGIAVGGVTEGTLYRAEDALYLVHLPGPGQTDGDVEYVGPLTRPPEDE